MRRALAFALVLAPGLLLSAVAQDKKPDPKKKAPPDPKPRIAMALPLGLTPGASSKITLRGLSSLPVSVVD